MYSLQLHFGYKSRAEQWQQRLLKSKAFTAENRFDNLLPVAMFYITSRIRCKSNFILLHDFVTQQLIFKLIAD